MRRAGKLTGYPSADYARATTGERLAYGYATIYTTITVLMLVAVAVTVATGHGSRDIFVAFACALLIGSLALTAALVARRRHTRRKRERAALLAALHAEIGSGGSVR